MKKNSCILVRTIPTQEIKVFVFSKGKLVRDIDTDLPNVANVIEATGYKYPICVFGDAIGYVNLVGEKLIQEKYERKDITMCDERGMLQWLNT